MPIDLQNTFLAVTWLFPNAPFVTSNVSFLLEVLSCGQIVRVGNSDPSLSI